MEREWISQVDALLWHLAATVAAHFRSGIDQTSDGQRLHRVSQTIDVSVGYYWVSQAFRVFFSIFYILFALAMVW